MKTIPPVPAMTEKVAAQQEYTVQRSSFRMKEKPGANRHLCRCFAVFNDMKKHILMKTCLPASGWLPNPLIELYHKNLVFTMGEQLEIYRKQEFLS